MRPQGRNTAVISVAPGLHCFLPGLDGRLPGSIAGVSDSGLDAGLAAQVLEGLELPNLARVIEGARRVESVWHRGPLEHQLFERFGRSARPAGDLQAPGGVQPELPVGPLCYRWDFSEPPQRWCLRADPVHLEAGLRDVSLSAGPELAIQPDEAAEFVSALNEHFAPDGHEFRAGPGWRWYLLTAEPIEANTLAPRPPPGVRLENLLPGGPDGLSLHRLMNEAQMVLHDHPANHRRRARKLAPINGVWLWGGGQTVSGKTLPWNGVFSDDELTQALSDDAGIGCRPSQQFEESSSLDGAPGMQTTLLVDTAGHRALEKGDFAAFRAWLEQLETQVMTPLADRVRDRTIPGATIDWGADAVLRFEPPTGWRRWFGAGRGGPSLAELLAGNSS